MLTSTPVAHPYVAERPSAPRETDRDRSPVMWGRLSDLTVADLVVFVQQTRKSGILRVDGETEQAVLGFYQGELINGTSDSSSRLGEALVERGVVDLEAVEAALEYQRLKNGSRNLGQCLVDLGATTQSAITSVVAELTQDTVTRLLGCRSGSFDFTIGAPPGFDEIDPADIDPRLEGQKIHTVRVLLEAARQVDEARAPEALV